MTKKDIDVPPSVKKDKLRQYLTPQDRTALMRVSKRQMEWVTPFVRVDRRPKEKALTYVLRHNIPFSQQEIVMMATQADHMTHVLDYAAAHHHQTRLFHKLIHVAKEKLLSKSKSTLVMKKTLMKQMIEFLHRWRVSIPVFIRSLSPHPQFKSLAIQYYLELTPSLSPSQKSKWIDQIHDHALETRLRHALL